VAAEEVRGSYHRRWTRILRFAIVDAARPYNRLASYVLPTSETLRERVAERSL
jgi:hypothetical protein